MIGFVFKFLVVKHNEFAAFSAQDALEAPMAAPAPRELPKASQIPPICLREQKNIVWVLVQGLF